MLHRGGYHNDIWFAKEDEEVKIVAEAFLFFFPVTPELNGGN